MDGWIGRSGPVRQAGRRARMGRSGRSDNGVCVHACSCVDRCVHGDMPASMDVYLRVCRYRKVAQMGSDGIYYNAAYL